MKTLTLTTCLLASLLASTAMATCPSQGGGLLPLPARAVAIPTVIRSSLPWPGMSRPNWVPPHLVRPNPVHRPITRPAETPVRNVQPVRQIAPATYPVASTPVTTTVRKTVAPPVAKPKVVTSVSLVNQAKKAFKNEQYGHAEDLMDKVIKMEPDSSAAYQFRSLINFADGDFEAGAADAYDTLMKGPVWSWETIASLYDDSKTYEAQYLELAKAAAKDDNSMSKHFLLAFHHLALGHEDQGKAELVKVLEIQPNEPLTQKMLEKLGGKESNKQLASK